MAKDITSKNIDGITDLVVVAPIREGFIEAYENVTYDTRLKIVAEALHALRVAAREREDITPFSDTTQRILTLLDFRIGVLDRDMFELDTDRGLIARRYLYLTATFDGAWEPYMRLIWKPLGDFLDLLFCNCEGYVTAGDHSFADYAKWVRSAQVDSAIFYATTGTTVRDALYLNKLEALQRAGCDDLTLAQLTIPHPEETATMDRNAHKDQANELALEALTVLYKLADYYPPDRVDPGKKLDDVPAPSDRAEGGDKTKDTQLVTNLPIAEGRYLVRAARNLLKGWDSKGIDPALRFLYKEPLTWFENHADFFGSQADKLADPVFDSTEVQAGILANPASAAQTDVHGALLLMTATDAQGARDFIASLAIDYNRGPDPIGGIYRTIAFTAHGLKRLGLYKRNLDKFPKEFREGMDVRSGLLGDMRENHPRNWILPERNWPPLTEEPEIARPPVELHEVDFVIQLRHPGGSEASILAEIKSLSEAAAGGAVVAAYQPMSSYIQPSPAEGQTLTTGHFNLLDGISQPIVDPKASDLATRPRDVVRLGEAICGYRNDRDDYASKTEPGKYDLQFNGSFLVIRKIEQHPETFEGWLTTTATAVAKKHGIDFGPDDLAARLLGRGREGTPLVTPGADGLNDFTFAGDASGAQCPLASHIRRTNPREAAKDRFDERPVPRLVRRGMSYGKPLKEDPGAERGLVFMAYNSSIAEQYEVIQRWINGGNSTGVASGHNDPLVGVAPPGNEERWFRFVYREPAKPGDEAAPPADRVIRVRLPDRHNAFTTLHWGLYLYAPSRTALATMMAFEGRFPALDEAMETKGYAFRQRLAQLPANVAQFEWKRILEDFVTRDPGERDLSPDIWSAIRLYGGGMQGVNQGLPPVGTPPPSAVEKLLLAQAEASGAIDRDSAVIHDGEKKQKVVLIASHEQMMNVLNHPERFSVAEQGERMHATAPGVYDCPARNVIGTGGDVYVAMQPGDRYKAEAPATNDIMLRQDEKAGFEIGYAAAHGVLQETIKVMTAFHHTPETGFKIELRRNFLMRTLGEMCRRWFGLPDGFSPQDDEDETKLMLNGSWDWLEASERTARCPGDFLAPSRYAFYPRPSDAVAKYAVEHGTAIHQAGRDFVARHRANSTIPAAPLAAAMFEAISPGGDKDEVLSRNIIGMMVGMLPPLEGNLRGILHEWLTERSLWTHQAALHRETGDKPATYEAAYKVLYGPISRAVCKRPAPDLLYRTATEKCTLSGHAYGRETTQEIDEGDLVIIGLVSAAQRSLDPDYPDYDKLNGDGDMSIVFGGRRDDVEQPEGRPFHACPAYKMMTGAMIGIMAALLDVGRIQAEPAGLIVKITGWKPLPQPQP